MPEFSSSIHFSDERYQQLRDTYRQWWAGDLKRPIVPIYTTHHESNRQPSAAPRLCFSTAWDFSISPEQLIDARDWELSTMRFHGDAFPHMNTSPFGPGVLAAFMGCTPVSRPDTVWFQPPRKDIPLEEMHFELDENSPYLRRCLNLYEAGMEKWHGEVTMGMLDLGGVMDVLASFRGSENLLMDLIDDPDEVKRCVSEIQREWLKCYNKINDIIAPEAKGYTHWFLLYSEKPSYILQSDFSYMISPAMFNDIVAPELASTAAQMHYPVYHLDGIGEIPHLDTLLATPSLHGIQWVPGDGEPTERNWEALGRHVLDGGKKLLSISPKLNEEYLRVCDHPGQLYMHPAYFSADKMDDARAWAERFGITL